MFREEILQQGTDCRNGSAGLSRRKDSLLLLLTLIVVVILMGTGVRNSFAGGHEPLMKTITVHHGETLWTVAQKYGDPDVYILERVSALAEANNLGNRRTLHAGQTLVVPATCLMAKN